MPDNNNIINDQLLEASSLPLVSCIMPTAKRPQFIKRAIAYFLAQDYAHKELLIVYNDARDLPVDLELPGSVHLIQTLAKSIGAKRNEGCCHAKGSIIAQWDDDDIYNTGRLSRQIAPLLNKEAEITGLQHTLFYEMATGKCWGCSPELFRKLFAEDITGGTLVYLKSLWNGTIYPDISLREDAEFLSRALKKGARLQRIDGSDLFIYLRHGGNTWKFKPGIYLQPSAWSEHPLPAWADVTGITYQEVSTTSKRTPPRVIAGTDLPLVSCIMPTANRHQFLPMAIHNFLRQDYPHKELIIVDDGITSSAPLIPSHADIRYTRLNETGACVGKKRNYACELASGDIILHWDDDDWYAPYWISHQVNMLQTSGADLTGLSNLLFYAPKINAAWKYIYPQGERPWVAGATMAYKRELWQQYPFKEVRIGEDNDFAWRSGGHVFAHTWEEGFVSLIHSANTSPKNTTDRRWKEHPVQHIRHILRGNNAESYPLPGVVQASPVYK